MKKFLVVFTLPQPRIEHGGLKKLLEQYSGGNVEIAFSDTHTIAFLFTSDAPISEMTFDGSVFFEDSYLLMQLGEQSAAQRFEPQLDWLRTYRRF